MIEEFREELREEFREEEKYLNWRRGLEMCCERSWWGPAIQELSIYHVRATGYAVVDTDSRMSSGNQD